MTEKQRRTFDAEFKLQVVQMIRERPAIPPFVPAIGA